MALVTSPEAVANEIEGGPKVPDTDVLARAEFSTLVSPESPRVSWLALRDWVKARNVPVEVGKSVYKACEKSGIGLTESEFVTFCSTLIKRLSSYPVSTAAASGAAAGAVLAGPVGAAAGALAGTAYASVRTSTLVGAAAGAALLGPVGFVAGAASGSSSFTSIQSGYLGEPEEWKGFEEFSKAGEDERRFGSPEAPVLMSANECCWESVRTGVALCGSGGGIRAAVSFLALLAETEELGWLCDYAAALSGSCWSLTAWYAQQDACSANDFVPVFGKRLEADLRLPHSAWVAGGPSSFSFREEDDGMWAYERFASRVLQGHTIGVADVWGAHLANRFLPVESRRGGFGLAALRGRRPMPILTAVEPVMHGPVWTEDASLCERCRLRMFGKVLGWSRHHCRACGLAVCDACCSASFGEKVRRCNVCVKENRIAPLERTKWNWWELSPEGVCPIDTAPTTSVVPVHRFGRKIPDEDDVVVDPNKGGEPLGQLLGVVGSAFCATVERFETSGTVSANTARLMRILADPKNMDPASPIFELAAFHHPFKPHEKLRLGDAGFSSNLPLAPLLKREDVKVIFLLDASSYPVDEDGSVSAIRREELQIELDRSIKDALDTNGAQVYFDCASYADDPVSFHYATVPCSVREPTKTRSVLIVVLNLAKREEEDNFCPLVNAQQGGFCNNATASYTPEDYRRLVDFVRAKFRRHSSYIDERVHAHMASQR